MQSLKLNEDGHGRAMRDDLPLKRSWESVRLQGQGGVQADEDGEATVRQPARGSGRAELESGPRAVSRICQDHWL